MVCVCYHGNRHSHDPGDGKSRYCWVSADLCVSLSTTKLFFLHSGKPGLICFLTNVHPLAFVNLSSTLLNK